MNLSCHACSRQGNVTYCTLTSSHAEELMKYLKKHYIEKLNNAKQELGEELDCFGKSLTW